MAGDRIAFNNGNTMFLGFAKAGNEKTNMKTGRIECAATLRTECATRFKQRNMRSMR